MDTNQQRDSVCANCETALKECDEDVILDIRSLFEGNEPSYSQPTCPLIYKVESAEEFDLIPTSLEENSADYIIHSALEVVFSNATSSCDDDVTLVPEEEILSTNLELNEYPPVPESDVNDEKTRYEKLQEIRDVFNSILNSSRLSVSTSTVELASHSTEEHKTLSNVGLVCNVREYVKRIEGSDEMEEFKRQLKKEEYAQIMEYVLEDEDDIEIAELKNELQALDIFPHETEQDKYLGKELNKDIEHRFESIIDMFNKFTQNLQNLNETVTKCSGKEHEKEELCYNQDATSLSLSEHDEELVSVQGN